MIKQNTPEWLEMRKNKIGASDCPAIMGVSPYLSAYQLWEQKLGLSRAQDQTYAMQRGHELEEPARLELEKMTGLFFLPVVINHPSIPYLMASLDGMEMGGKDIAEIKYNNKESHAMAVSGQVPEKHIPQLYHQLEVCQLDMVHYFSFNGTQGTLVKFYRDDKYIKRMLKEEAKFWECMQSWIPPEMTEKDYELKTEQAWARVAYEWRNTYHKLKEIEAQERMLRDNIISMSGSKNSIGGGIKVTRSIRKGAVDYASIPELKEVIIDNYRKNPVESYRITLI